MPCSHTFCLFSLTRKEFSLTLRNPIKEQHIHVECSSRLISENPANSPGTSLTSSSVSCRKSARPNKCTAMLRGFPLGSGPNVAPLSTQKPLSSQTFRSAPLIFKKTQQILPAEQNSDFGAKTLGFKIRISPPPTASGFSKVELVVGRCDF